MSTARKLMGLCALVLGGCEGAVDEDVDDQGAYSEAREVEEISQAIKGGTVVPNGQLEAVGSLPGCTATLISHRVVLTAAHCVCPNDGDTEGCSTRTNFTLRNVRPVDDPNTTTNETATRRNVTIPGNVFVHPDYGKAGWLRRDHAVIVLDHPSYKHAVGVVPIPVARADRTPTTNDDLTLVGMSASNDDCSDGFGTKRRRKAKPTSVVTEAIRFAPTYLCPGDSGGPALDSTGVWLLGTASFSSSTDTYRPAYEVFGWIQGFVDEWREAAGADSFRVSNGRSYDLDSIDPLYAYWPATGVVGIDISSSNRVYTWYNNGTVTTGNSWGLDGGETSYKYTLPPGKNPYDIVELAIAPDDTVYAWYRDGTVSQGSSSDLDSVRAPYAYTVAAGRTIADIVGIGIAKTSSYVYTWYRNGTVSIGRSRDLDELSAPYPYTAAAGKTPAQIVGIGISSSDTVYSWYDYAGTVYP